MEITELSIHNILEQSLAYLEKTNPDDVIVFGDDTVNFQIRFSKNEIITNKRWASKNIGFFYVKEKRIAATQISDISSLDAVFRALDDLFVFGKAIPPKEDYNGIAEGPFSYQSLANRYDKKLVDFTDSAVDHVESGLNAAIETGSKHSAGILQWGYSTSHLMTNHGVNTQENSTNFEYLIRSFLEPTESGQGVCVGTMLNTLDTHQAGSNAGEIAVNSKGGQIGEGGVYNALFAPTVVADIVAEAVRSANPFSIEIGQSWLKDKVGENIASDLYTASDDATIPHGINTRICDSEGVPSQKTSIIETGVLKGLIYDTNTAKKYGTKTTANSGLVSPQNSNIVIEPGNSSFDDLISECQKPTIYVTSNWYTRATNAAEGIFSTIPRDGMFLIEKGEIQKPLRELRISDSYPNLVKNIIAVQNKTRQIKWWLEVTTPCFAPAMLIENVNFSTGTK
ncbi:MAG: metallopeptidase TldD-related protein [Candidatus Hodarchaeales archaeon]|jgi:PmbA protein